VEPTQYKIWDSAGKEVEQKISHIKMELEDSERKMDAFEKRVFPIFAERAETIGDSNQVPLGVPIKPENAFQVPLNVPIKTEDSDLQIIEPIPEAITVKMESIIEPKVEAEAGQSSTSKRPPGAGVQESQTKRVKSENVEAGGSVPPANPGVQEIPTNPRLETLQNPVGNSGLVSFLFQDKLK
jgi:hypothetical protein